MTRAVPALLDVTVCREDAEPAVLKAAGAVSVLDDDFALAHKR
ncbi:hypothetical protein ACSCBZ_44985 [Streptomyces niveiscabiei]|nr:MULTISPECIES: hypothetical protein [Streptomyces]